MSSEPKQYGPACQTLILFMEVTNCSPTILFEILRDVKKCPPLFKQKVMNRTVGYVYKDAKWILP